MFCQISVRIALFVNYGHVASILSDVFGPYIVHVAIHYIGRVSVDISRWYPYIDV